MIDTPQKNSQHILENKRRGEEIYSKDPSDYAPTPSTSPQNKLKWMIERIKQHKTVTAVVAGVCLLAVILTPLIYMAIEEETMTVTISGSEWTVPLKSGGSMKSSLVEVRKQSKGLNLTISQLIPPIITRVLQEANPTSKHISYYHKDSQIFVCFGDNFTAHIRVPEKGIDFVIPKVPQSCEQALYQMPQQLPVAIIKALSQASGKKVTVSTDVSYDAVYNKTTNEYTLLTHKKPYHPEEFGRIEPNQINLLEIKPIITNFSDIIEVTSKIAAVVSNIVNNTKLIILQNNEKLMKLIDPIQERPSPINRAANEKGISSQTDKVLKCARLGAEVMRCPESVWREGELKVKNINDPDPIEIWEIVIDVQ